MQNRMYGLIGLAMKAGKIKAGEFSVEKSIKQGKARVVLVAGDASVKTVVFITRFHFFELEPRKSWEKSSVRKCVLLYQ